MSDINFKNPRAAALALAKATVLMLGLAAGPACASWEVNDSQAAKYLDRILKSIGEDESVNKKLDDMSKFKRERDGIEAAPEPTEQLNKTRPSQVNKSIEERCPRGESADQAATQLWQICQEIVKTEAAQFDYSLTIYDTFKKRKETLEKIERDRTGFGASEQGKLQDNTNALLSLMARMDLEFRQYKLYMEAYSARLQYLRSVRDMVSNEVLNGQKGSVVGNFGRDATGAAILIGVLEGLKTKRTEWVPYYQRKGTGN